MPLVYVDHPPEVSRNSKTLLLYIFIPDHAEKKAQTVTTTTEQTEAKQQPPYTHHNAAVHQLLLILCCRALLLCFCCCCSLPGPTQCSRAAHLAANPTITTSSAVGCVSCCAGGKRRRGNSSCWILLLLLACYACRASCNAQVLVLRPKRNLVRCGALIVHVMKKGMHISRTHDIPPVAVRGGMAVKSDIKAGLFHALVSSPSLATPRS